MRSFIYVAAPLLAIASAQRTTTRLPPNPATTLLTQTNSDGVITGIPGQGPTAIVTSQPAVDTIPAGLSSVPVVATIPAGLPTGETTIYINQSATLNSFVVSVGPSATIVETGGDIPSSAVAAPSESGGSGGSGGNGGDSDSDSGSDSSSDSGAAPRNLRAAAGIFVIGAVAAVLL